MIYDVHTRKINIPVDVSSSGNNILVVGTPDRWIYIHELIGDAAGTVTLQVKSGSNVLGEFTLSSGQGLTLSDISGDEQRPRFECKPGEDFIINLSGAVAFEGNLCYSFRN